MSDQDGLHIWLLSLDKDPANPFQSSNQGLNYNNYYTEMISDICFFFHEHVKHCKYAANVMSG